MRLYEMSNERIVSDTPFVRPNHCMPSNILKLFHITYQNFTNISVDGSITTDNECY